MTGIQIYIHTRSPDNKGIFKSFTIYDCLNIPVTVRSHSRLLEHSSRSTFSFTTAWTFQSQYVLIHDCLNIPVTVRSHSRLLEHSSRSTFSFTTAWTFQSQYVLIHDCLNIPVAVRSHSRLLEHSSHSTFSFTTASRWCWRTRKTPWNILSLWTNCMQTRRTVWDLYVSV